MPAHLLVTLKLTDPSWVAGYQAKVPAIVHKHGGEYTIVSESLQRCEGDGPDPDAIVLFTFPSMEAIDAFLGDPDYAPHRGARLEGSTGDMFAFTPRTA